MYFDFIVCAFSIITILKNVFRANLILNQTAKKFTRTIAMIFIVDIDLIFSINQSCR